MQHPPSLDTVARRVTDVLQQTTNRKDPIPPDVPLMFDLGLDSLDMIEAGFSLEESFGFQFAERHPMEVLDDVLGPGRILHNGHLTELGIAMARKRMPELDQQELGDDVTPEALQQYYTAQTYARMLREFYLAIPDKDPKTGETVVLDGLKPVTETSKQPVTAPSGDEILSEWARAAAQEIE